MKRIWISLLGLLLPALAHANLRDLPEITVLADASLTAPLTEIIRLYSGNNNVTITASYDESSEQARKVEDGLSANLFISSHPELINTLKQQGVIDVYSLTNLVQNRLVFVSTAANRYSEPAHGVEDPIKQLEYVLARTIIVIGDKETPLGDYTEQMIHALDKKNQSDLWSKIDKKVLRATSSTNATYLIENGDTAGITYFTEAFNNPHLLILHTYDTSLHTPIIYQGAVVAGEHMEIARNFLTFLTSEAATAILEKHGFIVE